MEEKTFIQKLIEIQAALRVPKTKRKDSQVKFAFRTCEEILNVAKPLCIDRGLALTLNDTIELIGSRYYLKAKAILTDGKTTMEADGYCREPERLQIMSECQTTGAASSYARKVALGGLFSLDDSTDDPDSVPQQDETNKESAKPVKPNETNKESAKPVKPIIADRKLLVEKLTEQGKLEATLAWGVTQKYENIDKFPDNVVISLLKRCGVE